MIASDIRNVAFERLLDIILGYLDWIETQAQKDKLIIFFDVKFRAREHAVDEGKLQKLKDYHVAI